MIKTIMFMPRCLEKTIILRVDEHLFNTIDIFSKENHYRDRSSLIRDILTAHFVNIMLGFMKPMTYDDMQNEFMRSIPKLKKMVKKKVSIRKGSHRPR
jgi:hypothetical protein